MNFKIICFVLGRLVVAEACIMLIPLLMALYYQENNLITFVESLTACILLGGWLLKYGQTKASDLTMREGIAITGFGWVVATTLGMLPYLLGGYMNFLDALFESISGFTGTGATLFESLSVLPKSLLFWRMMTQWFGGLGIIVIFIALLPQSGQSTIYMYNAETTGPTRDRVLPRLRDMTKALFQMYLVFTLLACWIYMLCGLNLLDALSHAMSTIGGGGFSIYDDNAMHFNNAYLEGWMTFFMILAGGNFGLYYSICHKGIGVIRHNTEFKAYIGILIAAILLITINLAGAMGVSWGEAFRYASFQVGSLSTTGFVSADFDTWPGFSKGILMVLMICGGCAGSAAGGMKVSRVVLLVKNAWAIVHQKLSPRRVVEVHINGNKVSEDVILRAGQFFFLYMFFIAFWAFLLTADGIKVFDAIGISITTMGCVGPAFGIAGATCTYAELSDFAKSILCLAMLLGRLEMFTLLIMLTPDFWRKGNRW